MGSENENGIRSFTAGEALEAFRRVKISSGTVIYADANEQHIGVTVDVAASGAQVGVKLNSFPGTRKLTAAAAITAGAPVYGAADGKVNDAEAGLGPRIGIALYAADGDGSLVEVQPQEGGSKLLYSNVADSAEVENTTTPTNFDKTFTIPAAEIEVGDVFEIVAAGRVVDNNSTDTLALALLFGTEVIDAIAALDVEDADIFRLHAFVHIRAIGGSGAVQGSSIAGMDADLVTAKTGEKAEAAEDLSAGALVAVQATWSVAHADNEALLSSLSVIRHRK